MNKIIIYLFLIFSGISVSGQDSLVSVTKNTVHFTEKDIVTDNSKIEIRHFSKDHKKNYTGKNFEYEIKAKKKNVWDRFKSWLSDKFSRIFSFNTTNSSIKAINIILKVLATIVVLFVIYLIVKIIMNKEGQWIFGRSSDKKIIHYDEIEKNLHLIDFEKLIENTLKLDEKRLSIRYYYLWLLKKMSENQMIEWDLEKTNSDYLYEIQNNNFKKDFAYLSYLYNYIWYGEFELDDIAFIKAKKAFIKAIKTIQ